MRNLTDKLLAIGMDGRLDMNLTSSAVDGIRRLALADDNTTLSSLHFETASLSGVIELISTEVAFAGSNHAALFNLPTFGAAAIPLQTARALWRNNCSFPLTAGIHGTYDYEFSSIRKKSDITGIDFQLFQERFVRASISVGHSSQFAHALAGVLGEMCDNIVDHSEWKGDVFSSLIGYAVTNEFTSFAVSDLGKGILASLRTSAQWHQLATAGEALKAAVLRGATSRRGHTEGGGFKVLLKNLVNRNSSLRFRSDDMVLSMGENNDASEAHIMRSPPLKGFQVGLVCGIRGKPAEFPLKISH
jgi:hypothetical protein